MGIKTRNLQLKSNLYLKKQPTAKKHSSFDFPICVHIQCTLHPVQCTFMSSYCPLRTCDCESVVVYSWFCFLVSVYCVWGGGDLKQTPMKELLTHSPPLRYRQRTGRMCLTDEQTVSHPTNPVICSIACHPTQRQQHYYAVINSHNQQSSTS